MNEQIDLKAVIHRLIEKKVKMLLALFISAVVAIVIIFPVPRYYNSSVSLAPELGNLPNTGGSLASLASSMGFSMGQSMLSDAISPELYPKLMKSNNFVVNLINIPVRSADGKINTTYYNYLLKDQKQSPWAMIAGAIKSLFPKKKQGPESGNGTLNTFKLTEEQNAIFEAITSKVTCSVDKKTSLITISVEDQDPVIAATVAKEASNQLQSFIARYRTSKARNDVVYYKKLTQQAKAIYEKSRRLYGSYADANTDIILESYKSKQEDLENDMQLKFNNYSALNTQLQAAEAKLQEKTPVFTTVQAASVPLRPAGPKRLMFVIGVIFLTFIVTLGIICRDLIL